VTQQFEQLGGSWPRVRAIVEPEVDIHCPDKAKAEELLRAAILESFADCGRVSW